MASDSLPKESPVSPFSRLKRFVVGKSLETLLPALSTTNPKLLVKMMDRISGYGVERMKKNHKGTPEELERRISAARAFFEMARRKFPSLSKETRRLLATNAFFRAAFQGDEKRAAYFAKHGEYPPFFLLTSPTMACNLRCTGCYAWKYPKDAGLSRETMTKIIREAKEDMGIHFFPLSGGEPTVWPHLEPIAAENQDVFFMIYTHGQNIDAAMAEAYRGIANTGEIVILIRQYPQGNRGLNQVFSARSIQSSRARQGLVS